MRIWDVDPGFLSDRSLLGEHGELHGLISVVRRRRKGYSSHPETKRWRSHIKSLIVRHDVLVAEMALRGFSHKSPLSSRSRALQWPPKYLDPPHVQFAILGEKYQNRPSGRIPIPRTLPELWASHKYSVIARSPQKAKEFGGRVADKAISYADLAGQLVILLRTQPDMGTLRNAFDHMWGYVGKFLEKKCSWSSLSEKFLCLQHLVKQHGVVYLLHSTALGELMYWIGRS